MKKKLARAIGRLKRGEVTAGPAEAPAGPARITKETVIEHRRATLGRAKKYVYPLRPPKRRVVTVSVTLFIALLVGFFGYTTLALYRFHNTSTLMYRITQIVPFPIARIGDRFIAYENYLFELRHFMHYYENHQQVDFRSDAGQRQLAEFRRRALDKVVNDAYVQKLADQHNVSVSEQEVQERIRIVREQNRLGGSEQVLEDVLQEFWGWSLADFERSLRQQLLEQKVVATLDTETNRLAEAALSELRAGASFADTARQHSQEETTRVNGGSFGFDITPNDRNLTAKTIATLFSLAEGQHSGIVNIGYGLEIVKVTKRDGDRIQGAHILFKFKDISEYINDLKEIRPARTYLSLPSPAEPGGAYAPFQATNSNWRG